MRQCNSILVDFDLNLTVQDRLSN